MKMQAQYSFETLGTAHPLTKHHYPAVICTFRITLVGKAKKNILLPVKIHDDSYSFDIVESECDNQIALSRTTVKGERIFENLHL